ncbi:hypothetical protein M0804_013291 [Polistes exclamans]|nr:hypothetical protein M0804_013291 [Polistes exclamans]
MSNQGLLCKVNLITHLQNRALALINIYNPENDVSFYAWLNRFEYVADVIDVPDDKMIEFFEVMVDNEVHKNVKRTISSDNLVKLDYKNMIRNYLLYFATSNEIDLHRKRFMCRKQYENETIQNYAKSLSTISTNFVSKCSLDKELYEQFLIGIRDDNMRKYLTKVPCFSFDGIVKKAIEFEENDHITHYQNEALTMINIYNAERKGTFHLWFNKFEYVADFIGVPYKKMVKFFNVMVNEKIRIKFNKDFSFMKSSIRTYEELIRNYIIYFEPSSELLFHRKRFLCRNQYEKETIENFMNNLRKILYQCFYITNIEDRLLKQFIIGIRNEELRIQLNQNDSLSITEMLTRAIAFEKANDMKHYINQTLTIINTFNPMIKNTFNEWLNKFEFVIEYFGIPNDKMVDIFNAMIENKIKEGVKKMFPCVNFSELSYDKTIYYYLRVFSPYNDDLHRNRFICRNQYERETIEKYAVNLWRIYNKCNHTNRTDKVICEQFLKGIRDNNIKTELKKISSMSFDRMVICAMKSENSYLIKKYINPALKMIPIYDKKEKLKFYEWLNKLEYVADLINVPNDKMIQFFNKMVNDNVHFDVKRNYPSINFSVLSYDEITNHYLHYLFIYNKDDVHKTRFLCRKQYEKETIEKYADSLRKLFNKCKDKNRLEKELCKQFINGIYNDGIKTYLNASPLIAFDKMVIKAKSREKYCVRKNKA